ncbi:MAG: hypothetical protein LPK21_01640, partial [Hymenobacteraceae bacterium]|nr:hypothetical protein [Hymenobacteraceae bacterium]
MSLKDASAYNIQFIGYKPFFIDILSFESYKEGEPWTAYRQFCSHFLAPLALMSKTDISLNQLLQTNLDGIPLPLASKLLPKSSYLNVGLVLHLHLHSKAQKNLAASYNAKSVKKFSTGALIQLISSLQNCISGLEWQPDKTTWGNYYNETNYSSTSMAQKEALVKQFLTQVKSKVILDLGANNGRFSQLAANVAPVVVSA